MKEKSFCKVVFFLFCVIVFGVFCYTFPYELFLFSRSGAVLNRDTYNAYLNRSFLSQMGASRCVNSTNGELEEYVVNYKLFNLINILSLKVKVAENSVYLGGDCLGFALNSKGLTIVGSNYIFGKNGAVNPFVESGLKVGDIIVKLNNFPIDDIETLNEVLDNSNGEKMDIVVIRNGEQLTKQITPILDIFSNTFKLGLWIKNNTEGVGTLTFIEDETLRFGALGHAIYSSAGSVLEVSDGEIYDCNVLGVKKGVDGTPGEIMGTFSKSHPLGMVDKNCEYGVFGYVADEKLIEEKQLVNIGGRATVKPGKAMIFCSLNGEDVRQYEIEIIKANYQTTSSEKSMVFRVTDRTLLELTGGIIQGMSGSPIVQDGKVVGAVTHVFVNDPTKGFGLYLDWMLVQ